MQPHRIVSREEWLEARKAHLANEKALTKARDKLVAERRSLPWVKVEKTYVFHSPEGKKMLSDFFDGRSQLAVYHFMLTPGDAHVCEGCSFIADHVDAARQHFEHADLSFVAISRAPMAEIAPVKKRMGWKFAWASSQGSDFNYDFGVSFTPEQVANGELGYNYGTQRDFLEDLHGFSVFARDEAGQIFHTYSAYARGAETLLGAFNFLDFVPKGRNETGTMSWVKLHDEYGRRPGDASDSCCHSQSTQDAAHGTAAGANP